MADLTVFFLLLVDYFLFVDLVVFLVVFLGLVLLGLDDIVILIYYSSYDSSLLLIVSYLFTFSFSI